MFQKIYTLQYTNTDPGSGWCGGGWCWKIRVHQKWFIFRIYVNFTRG